MLKPGWWNAMEECIALEGSDGAKGIAIPGHGQPLELQEPDFRSTNQVNHPRPRRKAMKRPLGRSKAEGPLLSVSPISLKTKSRNSQKGKKQNERTNRRQDPVPPEGKNDPNNGQNASGTENAPLVVYGSLMKNKPIQP